MALMDWFKSKKQDQRLDETENAWLQAIQTVMKEMVPKEVFTIIGQKDNGLVVFTIETSSKRAMVAFSEIQELIHIISKNHSGATP